MTETINEQLQRLLGSAAQAPPPRPPRILLYGTEGIGKSSFAAAAPNVIFCDLEDGLANIEAPRFPAPETLNDFKLQLQALTTDGHGYQALAIDGLERLEALVWQHLCATHNVTNIEQVDKGFGKGYTYALAVWQGVTTCLDILRNNGITIILIGHASIERVNDPLQGPYDRYSPRTHKKATAHLVEWADAVFFATYDFRVATEKGDFGKTERTVQTVGQDGGNRIIRTVGGPTCTAKNRYNLPAQLPLSWESFTGALNNG